MISSIGSSVPLWIPHEGIRAMVDSSVQPQRRPRPLRYDAAERPPARRTLRLVPQLPGEAAWKAASHNFRQSRDEPLVADRQLRQEQAYERFAVSRSVSFWELTGPFMSRPSASTVAVARAAPR